MTFPTSDFEALIRQLNTMSASDEIAVSLGMLEPVRLALGRATPALGAAANEGIRVAWQVLENPDDYTEEDIIQQIVLDRVHVSSDLSVAGVFRAQIRTLDDVDTSKVWASAHSIVLSALAAQHLPLDDVRQLQLNYLVPGDRVVRALVSTLGVQVPDLQAFVTDALPELGTSYRRQNIARPLFDHLGISLPP